MALERFNRLVDRIVGVESGGRATAKNPRSSAFGAGQFIKSTWLWLVDKVKPGWAEGLTDSEVLQFRSNPEISRQMVAEYAAINEAELQAAGLPVTDGNLYLMHFLGPSDARKVLSADPSAKLTSLLPASVIRANPFLKSMTAGTVIAWSDKKMAGAATATATGAPATVRSGSRGEAVSTLQQQLKAAGFDPGPIDGVFGPRTKAAVEAYQKANGLAVDGVVGPQTWGSLTAKGQASPATAAALTTGKLDAQTPGVNTLITGRLTGGQSTPSGVAPMVPWSWMFPGFGEQQAQATVPALGPVPPESVPPSYGMDKVVAALASGDASQVGPALWEFAGQAMGTGKSQEELAAEVRQYLQSLPQSELVHVLANYEASPELQNAIPPIMRGAIDDVLAQSKQIAQTPRPMTETPPTPTLAPMRAPPQPPVETLTGPTSLAGALSYRSPTAPAPSVFNAAQALTPQQAFGVGTVKPYVAPTTAATAKTPLEQAQEISESDFGQKALAGTQKVVKETGGFAPATGAPTTTKNVQQTVAEGNIEKYVPPTLGPTAFNVASALTPQQAYGVDTVKPYVAPTATPAAKPTTVPPSGAGESGGSQLMAILSGMGVPGMTGTAPLPAPTPTTAAPASASAPTKAPTPAPSSPSVSAPSPAPAKSTVQPTSAASSGGGGTSVSGAKSTPSGDFQYTINSDGSRDVYDSGGSYLYSFTP